MKLISLNTWAGRGGKDGLLEFFQRYENVDIFCLQEVWEGGHEFAPSWGDGIDTTMITNIGKILKNHIAFFRPHYKDWYGLAIFAKKSLDVREEGDLFVFKERQDAFITYDEGNTTANHARNLQHMTIATDKGVRTIANFHGLWNGKSKEDTPQRLLQADNIMRFFKNVYNPFVLCGYFNLLPENESLKSLESIGMRNLIKDFGVTSTRSSHYKKPVRFADYTLVSKDIGVNEFKVLPDEVSDHLAMYLDFE